jgi:hypothetical protein
MPPLIMTIKGGLFFFFFFSLLKIKFLEYYFGGSVAVLNMDCSSFFLCSFFLRCFFEELCLESSF